MNPLLDLFYIAMGRASVPRVPYTGGSEEILGHNSPGRTAEINAQPPTSLKSFAPPALHLTQRGPGEDWWECCQCGNINGVYYGEDLICTYERCRHRFCYGCGDNR